ncbi:FGGY-family carbohydrate kinase [Leucobacter luti]|uniref:FGGY-family pentulose kinase n=1 Tax=Leucobacter luti TaxID=340320 RepID=A0A4Q7TY85_9MICO|nr:FGGY-family carbohydrate kinase [Leucobacter luti]MBL3698789.1 sugar kinase [Leucobacter luti]RZT66166.1 FGGY-family pentulose kinase [Leucobacter luti]
MFSLAIDIGTEGARAGVFDASGARLADASATYLTSYPAPGWAEQHPTDWWRAAVQASRTALSEAGVDRVAAVSVATTASSVVVVDAAGEPLRPALLWMDGRAAQEAAETARLDHPALRFSGGSDSAEWLVPKAMWLARNEPETYAAAHRIAESVDYLTFKLSGAWVGSRMNATCKWNYDYRKGGLPEELYRELGVPGLSEKLPQEILPVGAIAGELTAAAAAQLGVAPGAAVVTGGIDAHLTLVALWGQSANPVAIVAGTSNAFIAELTDPVFAPTIWGPYPGALREDRWLIEGGQISAGAALSWLSERVLGVTRNRIGDLVERALEVPAAGHGLIVLDHFMGNRTPLRDPKLRGAVLGLTLGTTPEHLYRATVESVAYGTRQVLESFEAVGVDTTDTFVSGGIRHNPLWLQTTADVLGRPVQLVAGENLTTRALAALGVAATSGEPLAEVAARFTPECRVVEPDPVAAAALDAGYETYRETTAVLTDTHHRLAAATAATERRAAVPA